MSLFVLIKSFLCTLLGLRIMFFQRKGKRYRPEISTLAYLIVITAAAVPTFFAFGLFKIAHGLTLPLLIELCLAVYYSHGNIAKLCHYKSSTCMRYKPCKFSATYKHKKAEGNFASINRMLQKSS